MESNLRPMTLGEILDRTAQLYRENFVLFAGISAVYAGALLILNLLNIGLLHLLMALHMTKQLPLATLGFLLLIVPLVVIFAGAAVAANNRAVAWVNLGQPATIRGAYKSILPRIFRYLWLMAIAFFFVYLPFVIVSIAYAVFLFAYARPKGMLSTAAGHPETGSAILLGLVTIAFFFLALLAVVYAIVMALRYSLAIPASVVEDLKARPALRRSIQLSKGSRGRIFVLGLLISIIQTGLVLITQVLFVVAAFKRHGELPAWGQVLQQVVGFCTNSFIGPMYATGLTLFYYDQRIRKEGYDIEWMMEAAGLTPPAAVQTLPEPAPELPSTPRPSAPEPGAPGLDSETGESPQPAPPASDPQAPENVHE